jgi:hypothetical protein
MCLCFSGGESKAFDYGLIIKLSAAYVKIRREESAIGNSKREVRALPGNLITRFKYHSAILTVLIEQ